MGQREEAALRLGDFPREADEHMTVEEAVEWLDEWANRWNFPDLPKRKGLPPKGGTLRVGDTGPGRGRAPTPDIRIVP